MTIKTGDTVPALTAVSTGGPFRLAEHSGKPLVLYFYPKDNTPGCTTETQDFGDRHDAFAELGVKVFGVSRDSMTSHDKFKAQLELPFDLISDPDEALCTAFDVVKPKTMYGKPVRGIERSTFVIDSSGVLAREWRGVKVPGHVEEVLEFVGSLQP